MVVMASGMALVMILGAMMVIGSSLMTFRLVMVVGVVIVHEWSL